MLHPLIKIPGGKFLMRKFILDRIKPCADWWYEACFGGGSITLNKKVSKWEWVSDTNPNIVNLYNVAKEHPIPLQYELKNYPYCKDSFERAFYYEHQENPIVGAAQFFVRNRMSRDGMLKDFVDSPRLRRGMPENRSAYESAINNITKISNRLSNTSILNESLFYFLMGNNDHVFMNNGSIFIDPPYYPDTRTPKLYEKYEWDHNEHVKLMDLIKNITTNNTGRSIQILISGYECDLYNDKLGELGFIKHTKQVAVNMGCSKHKSRKTEILWEFNT